MKIHEKSKQLALMGMFSAIIFILAFTPIGFIQLPFIRATIVHIPVIIGSILLGARYGAVLGFFFGLTSLINNTMAPVLSSFVFSPFIPVPGTSYGSPLALIVCFVPRILVGVVPSYVHKGLGKLFNHKMELINLTISGIIGSLTNTLLVLHSIFFLFRSAYAEVLNIAIDAVYGFILGIVAANGLPEAAIAGILTAVVCMSVRTVYKKTNSIKMV